MDFKQNIKNGYQVEQPEEWLKLRYPWEIPHPEFSFEVHFEGRVNPARPERSGVALGGYENRHRHALRPADGRVRREHGEHPATLVGKGGRGIRPGRFQSRRYVDAVANKVLAENLTKVLYPNDNVFEGKELRLKQQYFFVSCSIQDILRRFKTDQRLG